MNAWAFERALGKTAQPQGQDALSNVERALRLYHGPFLRPIDLPWVVAPASGCVPGICNICSPSAARTRPTVGGRRPIHGTSAGSRPMRLVEAFYERLIRCYQHLGRTAEARATGERCRRRARDPAIGRDPGLDQDPRALAGALRPARRWPRRPRRVFLPLPDPSLFPCYLAVTGQAVTWPAPKIRWGGPTCHPRGPRRIIYED
ncbi:MAG: bacterial transcriptional activator domain-containing protein [Pseudomonadota bacterium]|nr:bacterial transcriptional activator domain-containing protein [Pseudomonadota bacterium]